MQPVLVLSVLSIFASVQSKKLILNDVTENQMKNKDYIFRSNNLYIEADFSAGVVKIICTLPDWFNQSAAGGVKFQWYGPDDKVPDSSDSSLFKIKHSSPPGEYKCSVKDSKGEKYLSGWDNTTLRYFPETKIPRTNRKKVQISVVNTDPYYTFNKDKGFINYTSTDPKPQKNETTLECICDGCSNDPKFRWLLDGKNVTEDLKRYISYNDTVLTLKHPTYMDVGIYVCYLENDPTTLGFISVEGAPVFSAKGGKASDNKLEGETVTVTNELYGNPITSYTWRRRMDDDGPQDAGEIFSFYSTKEDKDKKKSVEEFAEKNPGFTKRIRTYPTLDAPNAELEVVELEKNDRSTFVAEAVGLNGEKAYFQNLVRVKGKLDALWPFLGIVAEVIILVAIIFIYERRRAKQESEADAIDTHDQKEPLKSNDNVRQRNLKA